MRPNRHDPDHVNPPDYTFDDARLAALHRQAILDTPAERGFDGIAHLAAHICETPVALVSLVAHDRQWFKARIGFALRETDLGSSVCAHALVAPDILVIPDLTQDTRTTANPLVTGEPHIRFYAGAPFHAATGEVLGSLCVIDTKTRPHGLTDAQAECLRALARQVSALLGMRRAIDERDHLAARQRDSEVRRHALLQLGDSLREHTTPADMTRMAVSIVGSTLDASHVAFAHLDEHSVADEETDWIAEGSGERHRQHRIPDHSDLWRGFPQGEMLVVDDVATDPRTSENATLLLDLGIGAVVRAPVKERGSIVALLIVHNERPRHWTPEILAFIRNVADRLQAGLARLKAEAEQQTLNHELSHRLKNTFAMIQAIALQTLRRVPDQAPVHVFIQRLHALSAAHDVLLQQKWSAANIADIVTNVTDIVADPTRFAIAGPDIELGPRATLSLSLLLHELATNAIKYGSLSSECGRVAIGWRLEHSDGEQILALVWEETGGPTPEQPATKGFGSKLIGMGLAGTGGVSLRYLPTGLQAEFKAPLARLQRS